MKYFTRIYIRVQILLTIMLPFSVKVQIQQSSQTWPLTKMTHCLLFNITKYLIDFSFFSFYKLLKGNNSQ